MRNDLYFSAFYDFFKLQIFFKKNTGFYVVFFLYTQSRQILKHGFYQWSYWAVILLLAMLILTAAWANCLQPLFIHSLQGSTFIYWYNKLCQHARSIISSAETLEDRSWPQRQSATYSKHITGMKGLTGEIYCFIYHSYISLTGKLSAVPAGYYAL